MVSLYALLSGIAVGLVFGLIKLPIPAPDTLSGILGIVGISLGGVIATLLLKLFGGR